MSSFESFHQPPTLSGSNSIAVDNGTATATGATNSVKIPCTLEQRNFPPHLSSFEPKISNSKLHSYAGHSLQGYSETSSGSKPNQDCLIMTEDTETNSLLIACLDGHGSHGHKISQYFKEQIEARLFRHPLFLHNINGAIRKILTEIEYDLYRDNPKMANFSGTTLCMAIIRNAEITIANVGDSRIIIAQNDQNISYSTDTINDAEVLMEVNPQSLSGKSTSSSQSTASASSSRSNSVTSAGVQDECIQAEDDRPLSSVSKRSRLESFGEGSETGSQVTVVEDGLLNTSQSTLPATQPTITTTPGVVKKRKLKAQELTIDHKPHLPLELKRIQQAGGRVFAIKYDENTVGPPRVWLGNLNIPGLAMSRSLGDFVVHTAGVISTPEIFHYTIREGVDHMLIVGTDGIWDQFTNEEVISIASNFQFPHESVLALLEESHARWVACGRGIDDTTIGIVKFRGGSSSFSSPVYSKKSAPFSFNMWQQQRLSGILEPTLLPELTSSSTQSPTANSLRQQSVVWSSVTSITSTTTSTAIEPVVINTEFTYQGGNSMQEDSTVLQSIPTFIDNIEPTENDNSNTFGEDNDETSTEQDPQECEEILDDEDEEDSINSFTSDNNPAPTLALFPILGGR